MRVAVIGYCQNTSLPTDRSTCTVTSTNVNETITYECKGNYHEYEPVDTYDEYQLIEQKFIRHRHNRVKPSKAKKTKQKAGTKFMWHKQN